VLLLTLGACSGDDGEVASDPAPTTSSPSPTSSPSGSPTPSGYPSFEPEDYTYTLAVQCFCAGAGVPVGVTVEDGVVTNAVYLEDDTGRGGTAAGDRADDRFWLTINDIIERAGDEEAARVDVDWPDGQAYPNQVYIDGAEDVADDEIGYVISDVRT